jgi:PAT family beta-lactamase induction signal transducer AmpG
MYISRGEYKTSHFAISTGFMALGMMLPGLISGYIQQAVGYPVFFIVVFLATIPGMVTLCFIPLKN